MNTRTLRHLRAGAAALALCGLLSACASPDREKPGAARAEVVARLGAPYSATALESGGERLLYSTLPAGRQVFHLDFDAAGRLERVEQVLTFARFSGIALNQWSRADVERTFGPPTLVGRVARFDGDVWTYRFMDDYEPRLAHIHIDRAGTVRQLVFTDDQPPDDDRDF
jgi:hypothetical protein